MRRWRFLVLLSLICQSALATSMPETQEQRAEENLDDYRLPTAITPENYDLEITTFLNETDGEGFSFSGIVEILVSQFTV